MSAGSSPGLRKLDGARRSWRAFDVGTTEMRMDENDFDGTLVLEQLAAIGQIEEFFDAIDADDVARATALMKRADLDASTIATVVRKIEAGDGEH
jgi:hypothetical protein